MAIVEIFGFEIVSRYIKWMQQHYPTDTRAYINVIERCLQKFSDSPLYTQDMLLIFRMRNRLFPLCGHGESEQSMHYSIWPRRLSMNKTVTMNRQNVSTRKGL